MKLWVLLAVVSICYCSDSVSDGQYNDEYQKIERRIAGGGNYGGFIGLLTYGAGFFGVKGKYERNNDYKGYQERDRYNTRSDGEREDGLRRRGQSDYDNNYRRGYGDGMGYVNRDNDKYYDEYKYSDEYVEYLGYRGDLRYCRDYRRRGYSDSEGLQRLVNQTMNEGRINRCDKLFGFTGPTANDAPENLIRPCALDDWQCIRKYFATNGKCKPTHGPIPDPLYIDVNTIFFPAINVTVALPNLQVRGLSRAKITEFYINRKSGNLVLAIDVQNLNQTIPRAYFRYRRPAKESIVLADYSTINYRSITFTAVIPRTPHLRLDLADIHADVQDGTPPFFIGPEVFKSTDPDVAAANVQIPLLLPILVRQSMAFQAQLITAIFIQENICDFGLKIISV